MLGLVDLNGPVFLVEWAGSGDGLDVLKIWTFRPRNLKYFALEGVAYERFTLGEVKADMLSEECEAAIWGHIRRSKYYEVESETAISRLEIEAQRVERRVDEIRQEGI
jgi:hypothetical protein